MNNLDSLEAKLAHLRDFFRPLPSVMVAFSGGVDSTFVLKVAHETIGDRVLALTTTSPTMPDDDRLSALEMARLIGARHLASIQRTRDSGYARNPIDRCYLCKHNLFTVCEAKARELQIDDNRRWPQPRRPPRLSPRYQGSLREARTSILWSRPRCLRPTSASYRELWACRHGTGLLRRACRRAFHTALLITAERIAHGRARRTLAPCDGLSGRARTLSWRGRAPRGRVRRDCAAVGTCYRASGR